jgi:hypothetical protein
MEETKIIREVTDGAYSTFNYNGALMIIDYFRRSDSWQCMDAKFTIKGRGKTRIGAICDAKNQWDAYLKKNEL